MKTNTCLIECHYENDILIIDNIATPLEDRGKGYAKATLQYLINSNKGKQIELHAYPQDEFTNVFRLVDFYESFGFQVVAGSELSGFEMVLNN